MSGFYFQINEIRESGKFPGIGPLERPPSAEGAHVVVGEGASYRWWYCDGNRIQPAQQLPTGLIWYKTYSVFYREGFGFWILRGDAGNPGPGETWQPLCFDQDQYDQGASYLCNVAQRRAVAYRRETRWLPMLLPDIYYENAHVTRNEAYGGLKGELAIFLALIAFSMRPEQLASRLPYMLQSGSWMTHNLPHGRQEKRGVTVSIWTLPQGAAGVWNYERNTKYFS